MCLNVLGVKFAECCNLVFTSMLSPTLKGNFLLTLWVLSAGAVSRAGGADGAARGRVVFAGGAGAGVACALAGRAPGATTVWLAEDFTPLPPYPSFWRVLDNGTLLILPAARPVQTGALPAAVRCRATDAHGALVSPPIALVPVWEEVTPTVEAGAVQSGGVAALRCVWPSRRAREDFADEPVRWWRNDEPLLLTPPAPNAQYVRAGERGEWLLLDGARMGDRFSCQLTGTTRSLPATLQVTETAPGSMPRLAAAAAVRVPAGAALCLPCAAPDHPPPHYTWHRESGGRLQAASEAGAWPWRGGAALCFPRVATDVAGAWLCRAATARGDATTRAMLTVRPPLDVTLSPSLTIAGGGDTVRLECQTGDPEAAVTWLHQGAPAVLGGDVTALGEGRGGGALLLRATPRTRGTWQCEARHGDHVEQATAELRLAEAAPELRYTFIEQALRPGARVSLRCVAAGAPPPRFQWRRDDLPLQSTPHSHRYSIGEERAGAGETASTLNISAAAPEDGGRYSCRAANSLGHASHSARLNIYGPPLVRSTPPQRALAGENVTLFCPYAGYPISSVTWHRGGGAGSAVGGEGRVRARGAALQLRPALAGDAGRYSCAVTAPDGAAATADVQLLVLNPPKISPFVFSSELSEGNAVRVICSVSSGDRPLSFSWLKDDAPLSPELQIEETSLDDFSLLKFGELTERHSGDYTCRVTNPAASVDYTATLHVKVPPSWTREPLDTAVSVGAPLRLECEARGQPAPVVTWHRRQPCTPPAGPAAPCDWRAVPGNGTLWALTATRDLAGFYRCSADNGVGPSLFKYVNISIYEPAQIESPQLSVNVTCIQAGAGACALRCVARGDEPLAVAWARDQHALDLHSGRVSVSETRGADGALRSELTVRAVSSADAGEYRCRAANARGRSERLYLLHVEEPPPAPAGLRVCGREARRVRLAWRGARSLRYSAALELLRGHVANPSDTRDLVLDPLTEHGCGSDAGGGWVCAWVAGLRPGGAYAARVTAASRAGRSPHSAPILFTTLEDGLYRCGSDAGGGWVCAWVAGLRPGGAYAARVTAASRAGRSPHFAPILFTTLEDGLYRCGSDAGGGWVCAWVAALRPGGAYAARVTAASRAGRSPHSAPILFTTLEDGLYRCGSDAGGGWVCAWVAALRPGGAYAARVTAASRAGRSPHSAPVLFITLEDAPSGPPQDVQVRSGDSGELHVSWSPPAQSTWNGELLGYAVTWRVVDALSTAEQAGRAVRRGGSTLELRALRPRTQYSVTVRAFNRAGVGPLSTTVLAFTSEGDLEAPTEVRCAGVSARELRVLWTPRRAHAHLQYELLYAPAFPLSSIWSDEEESAAGGWRGRLARGVPGGAGEARVGGLRAATNYSVWVRALAGPAAAPALCATLPQVNIVNVIEARALSEDAVRVWWRAPPAAPPPAHYTLYARDLTRSGGEWSQRVDADEAGGGVGGVTRVVAGLRARARHEFWVRVHSPAGVGPPSPRVTAAADGHAHELARIWSFPVSLVAAEGAHVRLPCGADGSPPLRRRWAPLPARHALTPAGQLHIVGIQLQWAGNYTCSVRNAVGADSVTHTLRTRPAPEPPPAPAPPRLARATTHQLYLVWDPTKSTFPPLIGYTIEWQLDADSTAEPVNSRAAGVVGALGDATARAVGGLACGARVRVRLRAHSARGASPPSPDFITTTAGHEPLPPAGGEFVWSNSSALRLSLLQWDAPCAVIGWRIALRPGNPPITPTSAAWAELRAPDPLDDVIEIVDLNPGAWYEVRVTAHWTGGTVTAVYRAATLTTDGERIGESLRVPAGARAADEGGSVLTVGAALPAALGLLALLVVFLLLVWREVHRGGRWRGARAPAQSLRPLDALPPPPRPALEYTLHEKCDISDIRVMSARLSSAGSVCAGAGAGLGAGGDSASDSSAGEPCAACQRAAHAHTARSRNRRVSSLSLRASAPPRPFFAST